MPRLHVGIDELSLHVGTVRVSYAGGEPSLERIHCDKIREGRGFGVFGSPDFADNYPTGLRLVSAILKPVAEI